MDSYISLSVSRALGFGWQSMALYMLGAHWCYPPHFISIWSMSHMSHLLLCICSNLRFNLNVCVMPELAFPRFLLWSFSYVSPWLNPCSVIALHVDVNLYAHKLGSASSNAYLVLILGYLYVQNSFTWLHHIASRLLVRMIPFFDQVSASSFGLYAWYAYLSVLKFWLSHFNASWYTYCHMYWSVWLKLHLLSDSCYHW